MANNLEYIIMLHAQQTGDFTKFREELESLKAFVEKGADFPLRLGDVSTLKKQVQDAIRESLRATPGSGPSPVAPASSPADTAAERQLIEKITQLTNALDSLVTTLQRERPIAAPSSGAAPMSTDDFTAASGQFSTFNSMKERLQKQRKPGPFDRYARLTAVDMIDEVDEALTGLKAVGTEVSKDLTDEVKSLRTRLKRVSEDPTTQRAQQAAKTAVDEIFTALEALVTRAGNELAGSIRRSSGGSVPVPALQTATMQGQTGDVNTLIRGIATTLATEIKTALETVLPGTKGQQTHVEEMWRRSSPVSDDELQRARVLAEGGYKEQTDKRIQDLRRRLETARTTKNTIVENLLEQTIRELEQDSAQMTGGVAGPPGVNAAAVANVNRAIENPSSKQAIALASGYRWFDTLSFKDQAGASSLAQQGYVPISMSGRQSERVSAVTQTIDRLLGNVPYSVFSSTGSNEPNPEVLLARGEWDKRLRTGRTQLEQLAATGSDAVPGGFAALPQSAASMLAVILRRQRALEIGAARYKENFSAADQSELKSLQELTGNLPLFREMGAPPQASAKELYRMLYEPRNFMLSAQADREMGRRFALDPNVPKEYQIQGSALSIQELMDMGSIDQETGQGLLQQVEQWRSDRGLTFYRSSANREDAMFKYMNRLSRLKESLAKGELPDGIAALLRNPEAFGDPTGTGQDLPQDVANWLHSQRIGDLAGFESRLAPTMVQKRVDPMAYQDVIKAIETRMDFAQAELLQGGIYGKSTDAFIRRRGYVHPELGPMILTNREKEDNGELLVDPGKIEYGARHLSKYWFRGAADAYSLNNPGMPPGGGLTPPGGLPSMPGDGVRVYVTNWPSELGSDNTQLQSLLAKLKRATDAVAGVRPPGELGWKDVLRERSQLGGVDAEAAKGRIRVETQREILQLRADAEAKRAAASRVSSLLRRPTLSGLERLDGALPTGMSAEQYSGNPETWRSDVAGFYGRYRRSITSTELARLAQATETDPEKRAKREGALEDRLTSQAMSRIQLAQILRLGGAAGLTPIGMSMDNIDQFLKVSQGYIVARSGESDLKELAAARSGLLESSTGRQSQLRDAELAMARVERLRKLESASKRADELGVTYGSLLTVRDAKEKSLLSLPSQEQLALALDGAKSREAAAERVQKLLGLKDQDMIGFGPAVMTEGSGYSFDKVSDWVKAIRTQRQAEFDQAQSEVDSAESVFTNLRKLTPKGTGNYQERLRAAEMELVKTLGAKDTGEAEKRLAKLRAELKANEDQLKQLGSKSQETLTAMSTYFAKVAADVEKTNPKLAALLRTPLTDAKSLETVMRALGQEFNKFGKSVDAAAISLTQEGGYFGGLTRKFRSLSQYMMAGGVLYTISNSLRTNLTQLNQLDAELASVQGILDGRSPAGRRVVEEGAMETARMYGLSPLESVRSARLFAQTGASAEESVTLGRAAQAAQVGLGIDQNTATEMLVSTRNVFDNAIKPFEVLDRIARLEARYAVSTNDLSQAIQRAGPLFEQFQPQTMGPMTSMDLLLGSTTSIVEQTRVTGNQAATSLRFMLSRLAQPDVARKLQDQYGINLAGASPTEMRPASEILKDISKRYQQLMTPDANGQSRSLEAANLLVTFAGARQANAAAALLENFAETLDRAAEASMAYGDVQERLRIQLDTVPGRLGQFQAALTSTFEAMYARSGVRDITKGAIGGATTLTSLIGQSASPGLAMLAGGVAGSLLMRGLTYGTAAAAIGTSVGGGLAGASGRMMTGMGGRLLSGLWGVGAEGPIVAGLNNAYKIFGKIGSVFGVMSGIGTILAGLQAFGWLMTNLVTVGEKYQLKSFDMAQLRASETGQDLMRSAEKYGMSEEALIAAFGKAANDVFSPARLAELGLTREALASGNYSAANAVAIERAFVSALERQGVNSSRFFTSTQQTERINEVMAIGANVARFANAPNQDVVAQLRTSMTQIMDELKRATGRVSSDVSTYAPAAMGGRARGSLYNALSASDTFFRMFRLAPGLEDGSLRLAGSRMSIQQAFQQAASRAGKQAGTGPLREMSEMQVIAQLYKDQFELPNQNLQRLVQDERIRLTQGGATQLADATTTLAEVRQRLIEQELRTLQRGETRADAERRVNAMLTEDVQNRIRNQFSFQDDIQSSLRQKFSNELTLLDPGAQAMNGTEQILNNIVAPALEGFLKTVQKDNPVIGQLRQMMMAALQGQRPSQRGTIPDANTESYRGRLRERVLRPYLELYRGSMESYAQADLSAVTGRGYDRLREQQSLLSNFYLGLTRVGPELRGDIASAQLRSALLSNPNNARVRNVVTSVAGQLEQTDENGRRVSAVVREAANQAPTMQQEELRQRQLGLDREIESYKSQLTELFSTTGGFLSNLTDNTLRQEIEQSLAAMQQDVASQMTAGDQVRRAQGTEEVTLAMENFRSVLTTTSVSWEENMGRILDAVGRASDAIFARERELRAVDRTSQVRLQNFELQVSGNRRAGDMAAQDLARLGLLGGSAARRAQSVREGALAEVERQQIELERQRARAFDLPENIVKGRDVNAVARREAEAKAQADFENRRIQILRQAYDEQLDLIAQEETRIADAKEEQFQELLQGSLSGVRDVLMDFEKLRNKPLQAIVGPMAQTAQTRLVDNFLDSLFGPMGVFTDNLRGVFVNGAMETYSKVYAGHVDGMRAAADILKQSYLAAASGSTTGTSATASSLSLSPAASAGISTVEDYVATYLPNSRVSDLTMDERLEIEQWIAAGGLVAGGVTAGAATGSGGGTATTGPGGTTVSATGTRTGGWKQVKNTAMPLVGQMGGAWLGGQLKGGADYAQEGSSVGAMIGMAFGPVGGMVGGLLGGALGGLFGKPKPKEEQQIMALEKIERNTRQQIDLLQTQTSLLQLDSRFLNVGAGFTVPQYRPYGVGGAGGASVGDITINVTTSSNASAKDIGQEVARAIQGQLSQAGLAFDTRTM